MFYYFHKAALTIEFQSEPMFVVDQKKRKFQIFVFLHFSATPISPAVWQFHVFRKSFPALTAIEDRNSKKGVVHLNIITNISG